MSNATNASGEHRSAHRFNATSRRANFAPSAIGAVMLVAALGWGSCAYAFGPDVGGAIQGGVDKAADAGRQAGQAAGNAASNAVKTVDQFFSSVKDKVIDGHEHIEEWKTAAANAAKKKIADFTACPSPDAQNLYNDLKSKRAQALRTRDAARQADQDARNANANCKQSLPALACDAGYNPLPFAGYATGAQAAMDALDGAMNALKALKCPSGCDKQAIVDYPTIDVSRGNPITPKFEVCTEFDPGKVTARFDAGNGELGADVRAKLPKCKKTESITPEYCARWDVKSVLPYLKEAKGELPQVKLGDVTLQVPTRKVHFIDGLETVTCGTQLTVCTRLKGTVTLNFDTGGDAWQTLAAVSDANCAAKTAVACTQPPFGIGPHYKDIEVPDPKHAKLTWGGLDFKKGSLEIDLENGKFKAKCDEYKKVQLPTPKFEVVTKRLDLGYCILPRLVPLVSNP